jgi:hypothetical protein
VELSTENLKDRRWRLDHLYCCQTKSGQLTSFKLNWAQRELLDGLHECNLILKARQLGFTTFIQLFMLDACLFNSNIRAGTIAHRLDDARVIFRDKIKLPYDNLPEALRRAIPIVKDSSDELSFANNSSIRVSTSMRSGTLHYLHVSEYGSACANFPEKAREIRTGALNTLQAGQVCFIESTACGQEGHFFDMCQEAQAKRSRREPLTPLDFKFNFFPWWKAPEYELKVTDHIAIPDIYCRYFDQLKELYGIELTYGQRLWYFKKGETQLEDMKREFPSTPEEAFEASVEGSYYAAQLAKADLEQRIGHFPAEPGYQVHTSFDLGYGDDTSIWMFQKFPSCVRLVGYYSNSGEAMTHYLDQLEEMARRNGWHYGYHCVPHDASVHEWSFGNTRIGSMLLETSRRRLGKDVRLVAQHRVDDGIQAVRKLLPLFQFDAGPCAEGIKALRNYRKEWDDLRGVWKDRPRHDAASHGADAFRALAMSWTDVQVEADPQYAGYDPSGGPIPKFPQLEFLQGMTWQRFHELTHTELGRTRRRRERV